MIPHFVDFKETNNSYFIRFSINSIFKLLEHVQCGHRHYASAFSRDFQDVFHDIILGVVLKVSSVISCS